MSLIFSQISPQLTNTIDAAIPPDAEFNATEYHRDAG